MTDEEIVESSATDQPSAEEDVSQAESSTAPVETAETEQEAEKVNGVQKRINKLTRDKYEAQSRAKEMEDKVSALEQRLNAMDLPPERPKYENFDSDEAYDNAMLNYVQKTTANDQRQSDLAEAQKLKDKQREEAVLKRKQDFDTRAQKEADRYEGYWDAIRDPGFSAVVQAMDPELVALIEDSEMSTGLSYHLATNLELADNLANMPLANAARELLKIEVGLEKPESKKVSDAPPPVDPIGSSGQNEVPLDRIESTEEWMARRNAQVRGQNG